MFHGLWGASQNNSLQNALSEIEDLSPEAIDVIVKHVKAYWGKWP